MLCTDTPIGYNLYTYCNNNPVNYTDPTGNLAITASILIAAIIGGAIAGATINTISYLSKNEEATIGGFVGAFTVGAVTGGLGAAAGMLGNGWAIGLSLAAGLVSGTYTTLTTEGPIQQKLFAGLTAAIFAGGGSYLGSMIPLDGLSFGLTLGANTIFGMTIGGYLEIANAAIQGWIAEIFEQDESNHAPCAMPAYGITPEKGLGNNFVLGVIPVFT